MVLRILTIQTLLSLWSPSVRAKDAKTIDDICQNVKAKITTRDISALQEAGFFPRGLETVREKKSALCSQIPRAINDGDLQTLNSRLKRLRLSEKMKSLEIADDLISRIKSSTDAVLKKNEEAFLRDKSCVQQLIKKERLSTACIHFRDKVIPMLNERLRLMRQFLGLWLFKERAYSARPYLLHSFFASPNKSDKSIQGFKMKPLSEGELTEIEGELSNSNALEDLQKNYLDLLSQSPILLYFKGPELTLEELGAAYASPPITSIKEEDYIYIDAILKEVLTEIPEAKRGDYCVIAGELRKNQVVVPNFRKFLLSLVTLPALKSLTLFIASVGATIPVDTAIDAGLASDKLNFEFSLCMSTTYVVSGSNPLCSFQTVQLYANEVKGSILYLPLFGTPDQLKRFRHSQPSRR